MKIGRLEINFKWHKKTTELEILRDEMNFIGGIADKLERLEGITNLKPGYDNPLNTKLEGLRTIIIQKDMENEKQIDRIIKLEKSVEILTKIMRKLTNGDN